MGKVKKKMSKFDDVMREIRRACDGIETAAYLASDDGNTRQYLVECGCWEDTYRPEFNIIEYLTQYYKD